MQARKDRKCFQTYLDPIIYCFGANCSKLGVFEQKHALDGLKMKKTLNKLLFKVAQCVLWVILGKNDQ